MTSLTLLTLVVIVWGVFGSKGYGWSLAVGGSTSAGAALAFGATALPTFYAIALGAIVALGFDFINDRRRLTSPSRPHPPGTHTLLLFHWLVSSCYAGCTRCFRSNEGLSPRCVEVAGRRCHNLELRPDPVSCSRHRGRLLLSQISVRGSGAGRARCGGSPPGSRSGDISMASQVSRFLIASSIIHRRSLTSKAHPAGSHAFVVFSQSRPHSLSRRW